MPQHVHRAADHTRTQPGRRPMLCVVLCLVAVGGFALVMLGRSALTSKCHMSNKRPDSSQAAAFVGNITGIAMRYDSNGDAQLSHDEIGLLLTHMVQADIIQPQAVQQWDQTAAGLEQMRKQEGTSHGVISTIPSMAGQGQDSNASRKHGSAADSDTQIHTDARHGLNTGAVQQTAALDGTTGSQTEAAQQDGGSQLASATQQVSNQQAGTQMNAGGGMCPELSKELVSSFASHNTIMLTVSDWRIFETFGVNWMKHLNKLGVTYYIVGATDRQTSSFLAAQGRHPCFKFFEDGHGHGATKDYKYGDAHYVAATWRKVVVVKQLVDWGFNVIHSDVDVVWFRDPLPYFMGAHLQHTDIAVSTDLVNTHCTDKDEGLEVDIHPFVNVNTGVYFVKATPGGMEFMKSWVDLRRTLRHDNDQTGLYQWLRDKKRTPHIDRPLRRLELQSAAPGAPLIHVSLLGVHMLLNGYSYFIAQLHNMPHVQPLGVHMTWVPLSREGKMQRMRDGMLYHDAPEYYTGPLFITADLEHPATPEGFNEEKNTEAMIRFHLQAMDKQLMQMYRVMAVAIILNRTLVLPKLKCFCYKNWFMTEQCRIPGDRATQFPLDCTMDQWLRPKVVYNYGADIIGNDGRRAFMFRESTLFSNPDFPQDLLTQQVIVRPGPAGITHAISSMVDAATLGPSLPGISGQIKVITVPPDLKQAALQSMLLQHAAAAKIIRLWNVTRLFAGWDDTVLQQSFETFVGKAAGNWCCRDRPYIDQGMKEKEKLTIHW